jgi:hypothetical protein
VSTVARRRRGACGEDEAVALELEEVCIAWQGAGGGEEERRGEARPEQRVKGRQLAEKTKDFWEEHRWRQGGEGIFTVLKNICSSSSLELQLL